MKIFLRKKTNIGKALGLIATALVIIFLLNIFQTQIKPFFYSVSSPVQKIFWQMGGNASNVFNSFMHIASLKKNMSELDYKNQDLTAENARLKYSENENITLREALNIGLQNEYKLIFSTITGKDISQDFLTIDKGSDDGVSKNMAVITEHKVVVGRVSEVYKNFSKVILISNKKSSFDGKIQDKDISGIVKGNGNLGITLDLISRDKEISMNDTILTSNLSGIFPFGLVVGNVSNIKKDDVEPFQKVEIKPAFDINQTNALFLISSQK